MIITKNIFSYCISSDDSIYAALSKIDANAEGFVFCIDNAGVLEGILTDGDFRRWLMKAKYVDTSRPVRDIARQEFVAAPLLSSREKILRLFSKKIRFIPLLDDRRRLVGIARRRNLAEGILIGDLLISDHAPVFVIAEIGINHNGSLPRAHRLIDAVRESGANCVKFQMRNMHALYRNVAEADLTGEDLGPQYTLNLLSRFELLPEQMLELFDYSHQAGLIPLCTPWESESLKILEAHDMAAYKVASADLTNHPFLEELARTYKPLIVSTGMSTEAEIEQSVKLLKQLGVAYALLHCNSTYPVPFKDVNLRYMHRLKEMGDCVVGYSGHERGYSVALAAVSMGAKIIEKHITEDKTLEGTDHKVSLLPQEFKAMVEGIREVELALGVGDVRQMSQGELMNRSNLAKSLIINCDLKEGEIIEPNMIEIKSPGRGLQPNYREELIGSVSKRNMVKGDFFYPTDIQKEEINARKYTFSRSWGVTVRWHDFKDILCKTNPDFLEFHLSFKDMDEDYMKYFDQVYDLDLKVHSPDTFAGDHLLDLSNPNPDHRKRSIRELQRVVDLTRNLKQFFRRATRPMIICSLGGFSTDGLLIADKVKERYEIMEDSLTQIDASGVEIIGQTLPPFPWYFGGQMYLNLFVHADDTVAFCEANQLRLCYDISHSKLTCNYFKTSFQEFTAKVAPYVAHMHIADASGVDGEGLQIHEGEIDFPAFIAEVKAQCPDASFIPEIWQGHKNDGEGFWVALEHLEAMKF
ncbi:MAG TPA: N-acetylneuraminate synthase family protein [Kiritimatiellia bacterium]|nr:N-acetylneuraminate synthase family protein [Kiritimatiellia bacterium]